MANTKQALRGDDLLERTEEALHLVVGTEEEEYGLIGRQAKQSTVGEADADLPDTGRMKLSQAEATVGGGIGQSTLQVQQGA